MTARPVCIEAANRWQAASPIRYGVAPCALGWTLVAATDRGIAAIEFGDDPDALPAQLQARFPHARLMAAGPEFAATLAEVTALIAAPATGLALPLDIRGTAFQQRVWQALQAIPPGQTMSYAELAAAIGKPRAVRAVAAACAANKIAVAIPCHRVVRSDGGLSGYRWGAARKRELLLCEGAPAER